jgi:uncharacterized protein DUF5615
LKIKLDENLPAGLVRLLTNLGHDVDTVQEAAANVIAARMSSLESVGNSWRISSVVAASAKLASTVRSVTRAT